MNNFYEILWTVIGTIASGLATWLTVVITNWLNNKIKDKKLAKIASDITVLVMTIVQQTFQVYVEALKKQGKFDEKEQAAAKKAAVDEIMRQLTEEQKEYINNISNDVRQYISIQIEAAIYRLKNK